MACRQATYHRTTHYYYYYRWQGLLTRRSPRRIQLLSLSLARIVDKERVRAWVPRFLCSTNLITVFFCHVDLCTVRPKSETRNPFWSEGHDFAITIYTGHLGEILCRRKNVRHFHTYIHLQEKNDTKDFSQRPLCLYRPS